MLNRKRSRNICVEKIHSLLQQIMMSQMNVYFLYILYIYIYIYIDLGGTR